MGVGGSKIFTKNEKEYIFLEATTRGKKINGVGPLPDIVIGKNRTAKNQVFGCPLSRKTTPKNGNAVESKIARRKGGRRVVGMEFILKVIRWHDQVVK